MKPKLSFDHIHLISRDPQAAANWYRDMFGGEIATVQENLRGAPQIDVRVGGMMIVIRGQRPGERVAGAGGVDDGDLLGRDRRHRSGRGGDQRALPAESHHHRGDAA